VLKRSASPDHVQRQSIATTEGVARTAVRRANYKYDIHHKTVDVIAKQKPTQTGLTKKVTDHTGG
jgi:hypothetical protein